MADVKKPAAPAKPKPATIEMRIIFVLIVAAAVFYVLLPPLFSFFGVSSDGLIPSDIGTRISDAVSVFVQNLSFVSIFVSFILLLCLIYAKTKYKDITDAYKAQLGAKEALKHRGPMPVSPSASEIVSNGATVGGMTLPGSDLAQGPGANGSAAAPVPAYTPDPRWLDIEKHMQSSNQADWRVAILEADILLDDMLEQMGYPGESIGEKLKNVDPASFATIDDAWRAHRIRNIIAHQGANYELTRDEADRCIRLFKKVFEEFYFI